MFWKGPRITYP